MLRKLAWISPFLLLGCQQLEEVLGSMDKPAVRVADVGFSDLSLDAVTLAFDLEVSNPYTVALPLLGVDYALESGGKQFLSGEGQQAGTIPAGGKGRYPVSTRIPFADLFAVLSTVKPGSTVPYAASLGLAVDAPALGRIRIPVSHGGELPVPAVPDVRLGEIQWEELSMSRVSAALSLDITNTNSFPLDLRELSYGLSLGGTQVGQAGVRNATSFAAAGTERLTVPLSFSPLDAGMGLFNMLAGPGGSYGLTGTIEADTPFGAISLPYSKKGETTFRK